MKIKLIITALAIVTFLASMWVGFYYTQTAPEKAWYIEPTALTAMFICIGSVMAVAVTWIYD